MNQLVSVIIPYYNNLEYIKKTLQSVYSQSYRQIEVIIIYDGPDKKNLAYLSKILQNFKNIKLLVNNKNIGAGLSRNKGIRIANGKYIAFIDSDDTWVHTKLEKQIAFMEILGINFSHTSYKIINSSGNVTGYRKAKKILIYRDLIKSCDIGLSTVIVKKSFLKKNKFPNLRTKEDYVLWLKLIKRESIYGLDEVLCSWRKLDTSLSSSSTQKLCDAFRVYYFYEKFSMIKSIYMVLRLSFFYLVKVNNLNK
jgi:teichuronic acid biosynthesis glycosyltransferase TuaG